jgi:cytosine/uracil/thiamine/allantoin permease
VSLYYAPYLRRYATLWTRSFVLSFISPHQLRTMGGVSGLLKRLEVKPSDDEYEAIETSRWGNRDVYPVAHDKRTYGVYAYVSYWGE